jgi:hypothetical protein
MGFLPKELYEERDGAIYVSGKLCSTLDEVECQILAFNRLYDAHGGPCKVSEDEVVRAWGEELQRRAAERGSVLVVHGDRLVRTSDPKVSR